MADPEAAVSTEDNNVNSTATQSPAPMAVSLDLTPTRRGSAPPPLLSQSVSPPARGSSEDPDPAAALSTPTSTTSPPSSVAAPVQPTADVLVSSRSRGPSHADDLETVDTIVASAFVGPTAYVQQPTSASPASPTTTGADGASDVVAVAAPADGSASDTAAPAIRGAPGGDRVSVSVVGARPSNMSAYHMSASDNPPSRLMDLDASGARPPPRPRTLLDADPQPVAAASNVELELTQTSSPTSDAEGAAAAAANPNPLAVDTTATTATAATVSAAPVSTPLANANPLVTQPNDAPSNAVSTDPATGEVVVDVAPPEATGQAPESSTAEGEGEGEGKSGEADGGGSGGGGGGGGSGEGKAEDTSSESKEKAGGEGSSQTSSPSPDKDASASNDVIIHDKHIRSYTTLRHLSHHSTSAAHKTAMDLAVRLNDGWLGRLNSKSADSSAPAARKQTCCSRCCPAASNIIGWTLLLLCVAYPILVVQWWNPDNDPDIGDGGRYLTALSLPVLLLTLTSLFGRSMRYAGPFVLLLTVVYGIVFLHNEVYFTFSSSSAASGSSPFDADDFIPRAIGKSVIDIIDRCVIIMYEYTLPTFAGFFLLRVLDNSGAFVEMGATFNTGWISPARKLLMVGMGMGTLLSTIAPAPVAFLMCAPPLIRAQVLSRRRALKSQDDQEAAAFRILAALMFASTSAVAFQLSGSSLVLLTQDVSSFALSQAAPGVPAGPACSLVSSVSSTMFGPFALDAQKEVSRQYALFATLFGILTPPIMIVIGAPEPTFKERLTNIGIDFLPAFLTGLLISGGRLVVAWGLGPMVVAPITAVAILIALRLAYLRSDLNNETASQRSILPRWLPLLPFALAVLWLIVEASDEGLRDILVGVHRSNNDTYTGVFNPLVWFATNDSACSFFNFAWLWYPTLAFLLAALITPLLGGGQRVTSVDAVSATKLAESPFIVSRHFNFASFAVSCRLRRIHAAAVNLFFTNDTTAGVNGMQKRAKLVLDAARQSFKDAMTGFVALASLSAITLLMYRYSMMSHAVEHLVDVLSNTEAFAAFIPASCAVGSFFTGSVTMGNYICTRMNLLASMSSSVNLAPADNPLSEIAALCMLGSVVGVLLSPATAVVFASLRSVTMLSASSSQPASSPSAGASSSSSSSSSSPSSSPSSPPAAAAAASSSPRSSSASSSSPTSGSPRGAVDAASARQQHGAPVHLHFNPGKLMMALLPVSITWLFLSAAISVLVLAPDGGVVFWGQ